MNSFLPSSVNTPVPLWWCARKCSNIHYRHISFSVKLQKCENICIFFKKCIKKDKEAKDTRSGSLFLFLPTYYGDSSFVYIKRVWKQDKCFRNEEPPTNSLKTVIQVEEGDPNQSYCWRKGRRSHPLHILLGSQNSYWAAHVRKSKCGCMAAD